MYIEVNQKYLIHLYLEEIRHYNLAPVVAVWIILVGEIYMKSENMSCMDVCGLPFIG